MGKINMVQAINGALKSEMESDPDVVVLGEDVGKDGGVFRVTDGLLEAFGTKRVVDTPLAELGIIGTAFGMAVYGLKPVAEIQFVAFIYMAFEQVYSHVSRIHSRSRGRFTCPMVIRAPYGIGIKGPELHADSPESLFCHMPGLKVVVPSTPYNAKGLLISAIRDPGPVIFMEPSRLYRSIKSEVPDDSFTVPIGRAEILQEGSDFTVVSWGTTLQTAVDASEGFDAEIIDLMTLRPFDEETVLESVAKTGRLVIVHEATAYCGLGAEISAFVAEHAMLNLKAPIVRVAGPDAVIPMAGLDGYFIPDKERIAKAYKKVMEF
jgi:pyruvate dehydrogenase E1 component beta subunit